MWEEHITGKDIGLHISGGPFAPSLPSLLCVHGSGGGGGEFGQLGEGLAGVANTAAVDLPGHGDTPGPGMQSVEDYTQWVADLLAAGPVRPFLLGHSLGGAIALQMALTRPELISGLVLWGTGARLRVLPAILDGLAGDFVGAQPMLIDIAFAEDAPAGLKSEYARHFAGNEGKVVWGDYYSCDHFDVMDRLGEISLPTIAVAGQQDRLTPPKYAEFMAGRIAGAELAVIPGAGHMIHVEQPRLAARTLGRWLGARGGPQ